MCPFIANNISKFKIDSSPGKNSIEYIAKNYFLIELMQYIHTALSQFYM